MGSAELDIDVTGKFDENTVQDLLGEKVNQSDLSDDQKQAARENINQGFSFIGFLKKHAAKIAGVAVIITIGIVAFPFPGVGLVITTVCIVTLVGIATMLIFDDNTALIQPDKEKTDTSTDQTEPQKSNQSTEPDDKNVASTHSRAQPPTKEHLKETERLKEIDRSHYPPGSSKPYGQGGSDEGRRRSPIPDWQHKPYQPNLSDADPDRKDVEFPEWKHHPYTVNEDVDFGPRSRGPSVEPGKEGDGRGAPPPPSLRRTGRPQSSPDRPDGQGPDGEKRNRQPIRDWQHKPYQPNLSDADPDRKDVEFPEWKHHPYTVNEDVDFGPRSRGPSVERAEEDDGRGAPPPPSLRGTGRPQSSPDRPDGQGPDGEKRNRQPIRDWQHKPYQPNLSDADPDRKDVEFPEWKHHPYTVNEDVDFGPRIRGPSVEPGKEGDGRGAPPPPSLRGTGRPQNSPDRPDGQELDEELKPDSGDELQFHQASQSIDDEIQALGDLLAGMEDEMEPQQDTGYVSDLDDSSLNPDGHRQEEDYSDYGSEYGDDAGADFNLRMQIHKAAQSQSGALEQDGFQHGSLAKPLQSDVVSPKSVLTELQEKIFKHGMNSPGFAASLKQIHKDGTFLGQREICQFARKEILKRNKEMGMVETDLDDWSKVWDALNNKSLY
ncbi:hypothetical protein GCM10023116_06910 [Kistimonas scapharcae]|uniref:Uncharacterized protein n=1 Tax=Kistimonas scapharcae TaxID=1036133 RepID=A0ABP8V0Q6_9GAMM